MTPTRRKIHRTAAAIRLLVGAGIVCCALTELIACASVPPPTTELGAADSAITVAATPDGQHYAADELTAARNELSAARAAMAKQDFAQAQKLADAAHADADLASAKGRALAAQAAVGAKTDDNETLRHRLLNQETLK